MTTATEQFSTFYPYDAPRRTTFAPTMDREPVAYVEDDGRYAIGRAGMAWYVVGRSQRWIEGEWGEDDDGYEWHIEGEWVDDPEGQLWAAMVGDGDLHAVDAEDLTPIHDEDYCGGCGQIGCGW